MILTILCVGNNAQGIIAPQKKKISMQAQTEHYRLTNDGIEADWYSDCPTAIIDGKNWIHVVWCDERAASFHDEYNNYRDLYYKYYNGSKWSQDQQITFHQGTSFAPNLVIDSNDRLHLVWQDFRHGPSEIYYMAHNGHNWGPENRLTENFEDSLNPTLIVDSQNMIHLFWQEGNEETGFTIFYKYHVDMKWSKALPLTNPNQTARSPKAVVDSEDNLHLVWIDGRRDNQEIYYRVRRKNEWSTEKRVTNTVTRSESPILLVDSKNKLHLLWVEKTIKPPYTADIFYKDYDGIKWTEDQRLTEFPTELAMDDYPLIAYAKRPSRLSAVCDSFDQIHLCWQDERGLRRELFYMARVGQIWSRDIRLTPDDGKDSVSSVIRVDGNQTIHVFWSDHQHAEQATGNTEIYYQVGIIPIITVSKPEIINYTAELKIDIIGVNMTSNILFSKNMNLSQAQNSYYRIYNESDAFTGFSGNMTWTENKWEATNIDVSSLALGKYFVRCFFADFQTLGVSQPSEFFVIISSLSPLTSTHTPVTQEFPTLLLHTLFTISFVIYAKYYRKRAGTQE